MKLSNITSLVGLLGGLVLPAAVATDPAYNQCRRKCKAKNLNSSKIQQCIKECKPPKGDLGIRFGKCNSIIGSGHSLTLTHHSFPVTGKVARILRETSNADSVITSDDADLVGYDIEMYIKQVAADGPTYPNEDPNHPFWDELREVVMAQQHRRKRPLDVEELMVLPELWCGDSLDDVASKVQKEYPGFHQQNLLASFFQDGVKIDYSIFPFRSMVDFVGGPVRMAELNTWAVSRVAAINFGAKWWTGRPRPEEVGMYNLSFFVRWVGYECCC